MAKLAENEMRAIFVTADTPYWASEDPAKNNGVWNQKYRPANNSDLADYFVFLLNRYRSTGPHAFEIWNEENATAFWPSGVSAGDYFNSICPPTQMGLSSPVRLPGGAMRIGFTGTTGVTHSIQASTDLADWQTIATNIFGTSTYYDDFAATNLPSRFYRLLRP
jgi:hypothetical protein